MTETGHALQVVNVTESHKYELDEQELEQLLLREDVRDLPVVVVSVAGAYRGGKSFLLNFFLRYLSAPESARSDGSWLGNDSEPLVGFKWVGGIKRSTIGIVMWSKPFIMTLPSGDQVAVLLVDTQGTFDSSSTVRDNSTVFALSTLLSSVQIYNLSHDVKEDDLQHLELFTEYGKLVNAGDEHTKAFQVLQFLVRDWQFPEDFPYGTVGGTRLLQEKLTVTADLAPEMKELRRHIHSSFQQVSCFLMPHPGFNVLKAEFSGNINDIDFTFRIHLKDLVNSIFSPEKLLPKTINGEQVKAHELCNYFKTYMELFNSDKIPSPTNILAATVKAGLLSAVSESREIYEKGMASECGPAQLSVPAVDLEFLHKKYYALATAAYTHKKKMGSEEEAAEYFEKLEKALKARMPQFLQSNQSKVQITINKANEAYDEAIQTITKNEPICVHSLDLENIHKVGFDAALKTYDAGRKRVTQKDDEEREIFVKSFEKKKELLERNNERNNNMAVNEVWMTYWKYMQKKAVLEPPLIDTDFEEEHTTAQEKALEDFEAKRNKPNNYTEDTYKFNLTKEIQDSFVFLKMLNKSKHKEAMQTAINEYDKYIKRHWDSSNKCLHPEELEELHREGMCRSLTMFRPSQKCSEGFDFADEDEFNLYEVINQRHQNFVKSNDAANKTFVSIAYNEYVTSMESLCGFKAMWLLVIPYIKRNMQIPEFNDVSRSKALESFKSNRSNNEYHQTDPHLETLNKMMTEYYETNYKSQDWSVLNHVIPFMKNVKGQTSGREEGDLAQSAIVDRILGSLQGSGDSGSSDILQTLIGAVTGKASH